MTQNVLTNSVLARTIYAYLTLLFAARQICDLTIIHIKTKDLVIILLSP